MPYKLGLTVSLFAPLASFVDLMALRGLQLWRRALLLPWLVLYAFAVSLIFAHALAGVFHQGLRWTYVVLGFCALCLYSAWRHIRAQYGDMATGERPSSRTIDDLANDIRCATTSNGVNNAPDPSQDLPPKYEDLQADNPPQYQDNFRLDSASLNSSNNGDDDSHNNNNTQQQQQQQRRSED